ncbi:methyltransferase domain-containing protein [Patescibacteria group bacterium]|nr:methyltransferase domain-containing protein [Patescibacteria group bacterium]MBU2218923.1 methyltransferase domain-containing protein [Patescibacteria group bacterium]MBU2263266.1 methyltransferase domain-containing protein [Patescibacteria group bacterium]
MNKTKKPCCGGEPEETSPQKAAAEIKQEVKMRYDQFAKEGGSAEGCCPLVGESTESFALEHGLYSQEDLALIPKLAINLSRGCGNPTSFANLQLGEVVADLGSGGGIDLVLAAHKVGSTGKVIGIDFAPHMIERAKQVMEEAGLSNRAEFILLDIENPQVPDNIADVVISNCVINLCHCKPCVYKQVFDILKHGGRLAISDIVTIGDIDPKVREYFQSIWSGCTGGAIPEDEYFKIVQDVGFSQIKVVARHILNPKELDEMASCPGKKFSPAFSEEKLAQMQGKIVSTKFLAVKPEE